MTDDVDSEIRIRDDLSDALDRVIEHATSARERAEVGVDFDRGKCRLDLVICAVMISEAIAMVSK